ncbi:MAG: cbb3-type cytochrome oxidase assembly protein CcoS [Chroococcidiopsidaceae cyanobacterium CP_BM_ER_R8_30]|nr:cbb3-type cytochrome oxidase assembly protein CcoS [Chroococcidiopsidaceae cyanobacterium CP_BM_ER_R8_30]
MNRLFEVFLGTIVLFLLALAVVESLPGLYPSSYQPAPGLVQYTQEQLAGRNIYRREGCVYCHSQQVRPLEIDARYLHGTRPSIPEDYVYDNPHFMGTERIGPDLSNVGRDNDYVSEKGRQNLAQLLYSPRSMQPESLMPSYDYLGDREIQQLISYLQYLGAWKKPYSQPIDFNQWQPHYWDTNLKEGNEGGTGRNSGAIWPIWIGIAVVMGAVIVGILWSWRTDQNHDPEGPAHIMIGQQDHIRVE